MLKKFFFIVTILAIFPLLKNYYILPLFVAVFSGTIVITIVTKLVGYPNASIENAFFISSGWIAIVYVVESLAFDDGIVFTIIFLAYFWLIKVLYNPSKLLPILIFACVSTIFRAYIKFFLLYSLTEIVYFVLF